MTDLPVGTVTFLFTDIEGSTRLLQEIGDDFPAVLEAHNRIVRSAIEEAGRVAIRTEGDSFFAVFAQAPNAVAAAVSAQRGLASHHSPSMWASAFGGIHTGVGMLGGDDYVGIDVHRAARIAAAGHGGQILVSGGAFALAEQNLPRHQDSIAP